jgi:hypothetical protein
LSTDDSEVRAASIIRQTDRIPKLLKNFKPLGRRNREEKRMKRILDDEAGTSQSSGMMMIEAARTSETSVDNYFTRQYIPENNSELQACCLVARHSK